MIRPLVGVDVVSAWNPLNDLRFPLGVAPSLTGVNGGRRLSKCSGLRLGPNDTRFLLANGAMLSVGLRFLPLVAGVDFLALAGVLAAGDFPLGDFRAAGDLGDLGDAAAALGEALAFLGVEVSPSSSLTGAERRRSWLMDFFRGVLAGTRGLPNGVFCFEALINFLIDDPALSLLVLGVIFFAAGLAFGDLGLGDG